MWGSKFWKTGHYRDGYWKRLIEDEPTGGGGGKKSTVSDEERLRHRILKDDEDVISIIGSFLAGLNPWHR